MEKLTVEQMKEEIKYVRHRIQCGEFNERGQRIFEKIFSFVENSRYGIVDAKVGINLPFIKKCIYSQERYDIEIMKIVRIVNNLLYKHGEIFVTTYNQKSRNYLHILFKPFSKGEIKYCTDIKKEK